MRQHFWLEQFGDHDSYQVKYSDLIGITVAFVNALKNNSTLKSLTSTYDDDDDDDDDAIEEQVLSAFADALKVNPSLTSLKLSMNSIHKQGANAIACIEGQLFLDIFES
jgi:hypothetical protein